MSWRDRVWEQKWLEPFLPNYLKPLNDSTVETEETKELVSEAAEFLSDLATLSELPRINKTFKRNIKGYLFKVKIKQKKIYLELLDTKKSPAAVKKRIYITVFRKQFKAEKGMGKCADSTIYYTSGNRTIVRNVRNHPLFQPVFYELHRLDLSLAGKALPEIESAEQPKALMNPEHKPSTEDETKAILTNLDSLKKQYRKSEPAFHKQINQLQEDILICIKDMHLLDIEEKHHLKRMVSYDLPNLLETYDSLSEDQKEKTFDEVMSTVNSMRDYVKKQTEQLQSSRMDRMKHLLKLNEVRYNNSSENVKKDAE
ncbi:hypothetical protein MM300_17580 [Evansella sp. LMS18]|uniref:hypothetical protein n=1 Tax=Evansella sp. LMS18 TaxID=2924033 RepID=UPI0020D0B8E3|nr:hypothetical protein [Evansella sp. LMS18]UTR09686.1 hypothetical protein MM300_17580 [Evansella sp. LMS18]